MGSEGILSGVRRQVLGASYEVRGADRICFRAMISFSARVRRVLTIGWRRLSLDGSRVLMHRADYEDFWSLPGGRAEMLEAAEDALQREMREELEEEIAVERLVWVVGELLRVPGGEVPRVGLYFLVSLRKDSGFLGEGNHGGGENGVRSDLPAGVVRREKLGRRASCSLRSCARG